MGKYLITGATGVIGSALTKRLLKEGMDVVCPVRNLYKAINIFKGYENKKIKFVECNLETFLNNLDESFDSIIHCASPTASKFFVEHPVETLRFGIDTTSRLLDYCLTHKIKSMVYLSSLESYGTVTNNENSINEEFQGYVNPLSVRSSYNIAKRTSESLCHSYAIEYGVPVKIVRLTQTISSETTDTDMRIYAQFARKAAKGLDIELHTEGNSARQYIYIDDAVEGILTVLHFGIPGDAYNVANENTFISARKLAEFVQGNFNPEGKVIFNIRDDMGYAPTTILKLDTSKLRALGWEPKVDLYEMFDKLINNIKSNEISSCSRSS